MVTARLKERFREREDEKQRELLQLNCNLQKHPKMYGRYVFFLHISLKLCFLCHSFLCFPNSLKFGEFYRSGREKPLCECKGRWEVALPQFGRSSRQKSF